MRRSILRPLVLAGGFVFLGIANPVAAQRPTADQARAILGNRSDLVSMLRDRFLQSGMTPDQVRARLRAAGYPEDLLDPYLGTGDVSASDSTPSADVFDAVQSLGITDDGDLDSLRVKAGLSPARRRATNKRTRTSAASSRREDGSGLPNDTIDVEPERPKLVKKKVAANPFDLRLPDSTARRGLHGDTSAAPNDTASEDQLDIFGLSVFEGGTSQFDANAAGPVDANYRLGPGDRLVLVLTGDVEKSYNLDVTREGFIVIPTVGEVSVMNLTLGQLEDVLYARLARVYSGISRGANATTHFSVTPAKLRSNQVYVIGDVDSPGSYRVSATGTALSALYAAGGPTDIGSLRRVEIRRGKNVVDVLDVYDYLLRGDASHDPRLENGDVVFVPPHGARVELHGEVLRPAIYEMKAGETMADLIRDAGGFTATASRRRVQIERVVPAGERSTGRDRIVMDVASASLAPGGTSIPVMDGDVVRVFPVADRVRDRVSVGGNVWSPGVVGFVSGMTLSQALHMAGGLKPDSYLGEVLVSRLRADSTREQLRTALRDTTGAAMNDLVLQDDDQIQVFSLSDFRPLRYVAIAGAVKRPGRYPFREGMTMRDLVLMAGGMEERAWLREAEIARLPENRAGGKLATTTRVPLDSSYILDVSPEAHYAGAPGEVVQAGHAAEVALQPYDNVLILEQPDWGLQRTVTLTGEVKYPGTYSLREKGERLSDLIDRAGGVASDGNSDAVYFYRKANKTGRVGVDLASAMRHHGETDDLVLQDGDSIDVPMYDGTVVVTGAVNSPVAVAYADGRNIDYYIEAAGGLAPRAQMDRAYVTQPNGKVESRVSHLLWPTSKPTPRPGSKVYVPYEDPNEKHDYTAAVQVAASLASLVASLVTAIAIAKR